MLQGLAICGVCGRNMAVRYYKQKGGLHPYYLCSREGNKTASPWCQSIPGAAIDRRVGELLVGLMTPLTLDVALQVQDELVARAEEADLWRAQRVQRARGEADLARQRFMQTHPDNRMVADVLEAEWNAKLRALEEAQRELERGRAEPGQGMDDEQRKRILALASDFPRLWNDPATPYRERKRMARLLIEDVTLLSNGSVTMEHNLEPHQATMVERCQLEKVVLAIQDTTTLNYDGLEATGGLVGLGGGGKGTRGLWAHVGLAVTNDLPVTRS